MNAIRAIAVGLLVASILMATTGGPFFSVWGSLSSTEAHSLIVANTALNPVSLSTVLGVGVFFALCLSMGLLIGVTICVGLERLVAGAWYRILQAWTRPSRPKSPRIPVSGRVRSSAIQMRG